MTITAKLDFGNLIDVIERFPGQTASTQDDFLNEQCRLLISTSGRTQRGIVQVTPPHSANARGGDAKKQGERAVIRDIAKVYANTGAVYAAIKAIDKSKAAGYWKARIANDQKKMQAIASSISGLPHFMLKLEAFDGGTEHKNRRGRNGKVKDKYPSMIVSDPSNLAKFRKRKSRNVGLYASTLPSASGLKLGTIKGVPAWVRRHNASGGYVTSRKTSKGRSIILGITKDYIGDMQRRMNYVLGYRVNALERQLPYIAKRLEKKLQAQLTAA